MLDFKFDWCAEMEIGNSLIDTQHKQLFRLGRDIEQLVMCQCIGVTTKQLLDIVLEIREFVAYHFYQEEELMKEYNYPKYQAHKKKHDEATQYILNIDCKKLGEQPYEMLRIHRNALQDWIFSHILVEDKDLGNYINTHPKNK